MEKLNQLYKDTGLTANMEDYMETISILSEKQKVVRVKDIAISLKIKMPSVTAALNKLKEKGYIDYEKYGFIELTEIGQSIAESIYQRHVCLTNYYRDFLQLDGKIAEEEACKVEHQLKAETCRQIHKLLHFLQDEQEKGNDWVARMFKALK